MVPKRKENLHYIIKPEAFETYTYKSKSLSLWKATNIYGVPR